jgi:hypothetical protein
MTGKYRIKGTGDRREVLDEESRLVGYVQRIVQRIESARMTKYEIQYRKREAVRWAGRWPSSDPVLYRANGARMLCDRMLDWKDPERWTALARRPATPQQQEGEACSEGT